MPCLLAGWAALACREPRPEVPETVLAGTEPVRVAPPASASAGAPHAGSPKPPVGDPTTIIADPVTLRKLEELGFDAGTSIVGARAASTAALAEQPAYRTLQRAIEKDLLADAR